ncbi:MAG: ABC transporter ATP-binding protein [Bacillota bacterium]
MALISLQDVTVAYDKNVVLENFNLEVEKGQLLSLLGPSGCGKTTTLRLIAGFMQAQKGHFFFNEKDYTKVPVHKRRFGLVFQNYALFPHLTVFHNVGFGLKCMKISGSKLRNKVLSMLEIVGLTGYENRYPAELSGGQKQRVALARALVIEPDLLLLDEPLSNLDAKLRVSMRVEIRRIQRELGITTVYVTHDQEECFSISDKVAIMNQGVIEQLDRPEVIYQYPETEFVARFVGFYNFINLQLIGVEQETAAFKASNGKVFEALKQKEDIAQESWLGAIRPENVLLIEGSSSKNVVNQIEGKIKIRTYLGRQYQYVVDTSLGEFIVNKDTDRVFENEEQVLLQFPKEKIRLVKKVHERGN